MLGTIREFFNKSPWAGWAAAGLLLLASVFLFFRGQRATDPYNPERMREMVTIRFSDTGDEISMPRGQMDKELRRQGSHVDPTKGIVNPKTGQATGFLFDKKEWDEMCARINAEKQEFNKGGALKAKSSPEKK